MPRDQEGDRGRRIRCVCHLWRVRPSMQSTKELHMSFTELNKPYWLLRVAFGAVPIVAGLDKFTNLLTNWEQYLSPLATGVIPAATLMRIVGVVEIAAGILVLSKLTRLGAHVVAAWLVGIALNILTTGHFL